MELKYFILIFINIFMIKATADEYQCAFRPFAKDEMPASWNSQMKKMFSDELTKLERKLEKKFGSGHRTLQKEEWVDTTVGDAELLTDRAVLGGYDYNGSPLWIIKGFIYDTETIGKMLLTQKKTFYGHNTTEYYYTGETIRTKVLCAPAERVRWVESRNGFVPPNALVGMTTQDGEKVYIGRAKEQDSLIPGPIYPSEKALFITYGGKNIRRELYEVLCLV